MVAGEDDVLALISPEHHVDELSIEIRGEVTDLLRHPLRQAGDGLAHVLVVGGEVGDLGGVEDRRAGVAPDGERVLAAGENDGGAARHEIVASGLRREPQGFWKGEVLHGEGLHAE